ncbi:hypothetical protein [Actinomadura macrotermitis]|uniref:Uncharacterized protein n=1 Tax=Actinomadura macrotermitis TaxID=2585200 RepID=A0A7K0BXP5_9ACTN|nr:hypothetical protein [Actinomadura macrotermitis]MQY05856.1 hypothetical protein [Actinomadura macrotermitis]
MRTPRNGLPAAPPPPPGAQGAGAPARRVLYCRDARLIVDGPSVDFLDSRGCSLRLPLDWCAKAEARSLPGTEQTQLTLHFAFPPMRPGEEPPVLAVVRVQVDGPYLPEAEELLADLRARAAARLGNAARQDPAPAPPAAVPPAPAPPVTGPSAPAPADARRPPAAPPAVRADAPVTGRTVPWTAPQTGEWLSFPPLPASAEVLDDLVRWASAPAPAPAQTRHL